MDGFEEVAAGTWQFLEDAAEALPRYFPGLGICAPDLVLAVVHRDSHGRHALTQMDDGVPSGTRARCLFGQ